ncbi:glucose-6-phosphate dehydrogenase assembly protein OpcA [Ornithinimicrobium sufpigmenti]|uniref:glucose-6-phosphate dehydrogenase assembly protein OpcA n=1 Tax=Ornithinimicrobium sufpigmenti TaxID=2508882 RepID=UPI0010366044|nr:MULTISPECIES: glucose-6-phosphate dehydrogenase assembly protein OpcA [unclassified Ornithinimicrobium]
MIVDLPDASTRDVAQRLVQLRQEVGAMAMGRVLTLLVSVDEDGLDRAVSAANEATRQHPARILVVVPVNTPVDQRDDEPSDEHVEQGSPDRLDAEIRVGGDAGASEVVVLRLHGELTRHGSAVVIPLLLPDSPVVAWWPGDSEEDVAGTPLGSMALRRVTDADRCTDPAAQLRRRARYYRPGDTDLAWTRLTRWRALLASSLDGRPYEPVTSVEVLGEPGRPSGDLLAGWLAESLRCPVTQLGTPEGSGLVGVRLVRGSGPIELIRSEDGSDTATLTRPGTPPRLVALHTPSLPEALAEELRRLDPDEVYARALCEGLPLVT